MASAETLERLIRAMSVIRSGPGRIMSEAEVPSRVALVLRGTVAATWDSPDGQTVYAGLYGPHQFMGLATLAGGPMVVGIDALTKVTLLAWDTPTFRRIATADPPMAVDLLDRAIYAIQALNHLIKLRTYASARSRLAALLLRYEAICCSSDSPLVPRGQLSALAGVTPRMVSTILREWETAGVVRRYGTSGLELLDRNALKAESAALEAFTAPDPTSPGAWTRPEPTIQPSEEA